MQGLQQLAGSMVTNLPHLPGTVSALVLKDPHSGKPLSLEHAGLVTSLSWGEGVSAALRRPVQLPALAIALKQEEAFLKTSVELRKSKLCCLDVPKISERLGLVKQQPIFSSKA